MALEANSRRRRTTFNRISDRGIACQPSFIHPAYVPHLPPHHAFVPECNPLARWAASGPGIPGPDPYLATALSVRLIARLFYRLRGQVCPSLILSQPMTLRRLYTEVGHADSGVVGQILKNHKLVWFYSGSRHPSEPNQVLYSISG